MLTLISVNPENGDLIADIADVEATWETDNTDDPVTSVVIKRNGISYPVFVLQRGFGRVSGFANVGLFPEDVSGTMRTEATTLLGVTGSLNWSFTCRRGFQVPTEIGQILRYNGELVLAKSHLYCSTLGVGSTTERLHLFIRPIISLEAQLLEIQVIKFVGASEFVVANIAATRQIEQLLAALTAGTSVQSYNFTLVTGESHDESFHPATQHGEVLTRVNGEFTYTNEVSNEVAIPGVWVVDLTTVEGKALAAILIQAINVSGGDGINIFLDILDNVLDEVR